MCSIYRQTWLWCFTREMICIWLYGFLESLYLNKITTKVFSLISKCGMKTTIFWSTRGKWALCCLSYRGWLFILSRTHYLGQSKGTQEWSPPPSKYLIFQKRRHIERACRQTEVEVIYLVPPSYYDYNQLGHGSWRWNWLRPAALKILK